MNFTKWLNALHTFIDPRSYLHVFRMIHYYGYSHVQPRARMQVGSKSEMAPNVSLRNGSRIVIGANCHIGENCSLWAGDNTGRIILGDNISLGPGVFLTASDYQISAGTPFQSQKKRERDVRIDDDVWLGTGVIVTAGVTIEEGCIVGAGAVVTHDIPAGSIAVGVPARVIGKRTYADQQLISI